MKLPEPNPAVQAIMQPRAIDRGENEGGENLAVPAPRPGAESDHPTDSHDEKTAGKQAPAFSLKLRSWVTCFYNLSGIVSGDDIASACPVSERGSAVNPATGPA